MPVLALASNRRRAFEGRLLTGCRLFRRIGLDRGHNAVLVGVPLLERFRELENRAMDSVRMVLMQS